ncbi:MAG: hypothetical protein LQ338_006952 [Usnochroma carphineum]|nr:MAG: hypothetical protein LQ338_006952 [Usnochroma carphineum]
MDPVFKIPASPGTPLFPVSPERANRQALSHSPSLPSNLQDPYKSAHSRENSDVQSKVAQFNSLSKEAVQRRKDNEAAMRRAVLGREEAESEAKRMKEESKMARKELEEGKMRERKVAERLESVMEELHRNIETQAHAQGVYEKEVRRARKEAFKSSSALVKLQEELKTTRNRYTLMREEVEAHKRKLEAKDQETFAAQYRLIGLQEELETTRQKCRTTDEERDALKTSLKQEEVARVAAEGKIALPPSEETDEFSSPKKRRRESFKENVDPEAMEIEAVSELDTLRQELGWEKKARKQAESLVEFMKMECQFRCCSCRIAEEEGTEYINDGSYFGQAREKEQAPAPKDVHIARPSSIPPPQPSDSASSSPPRAASPLGQTTEMLINFSPSRGTFFDAPTPAKRDLPELPPLPTHSSSGNTTAATKDEPAGYPFPSMPQQHHSPKQQTPRHQHSFPPPQTPRPLPLPNPPLDPQQQQHPQTTLPTIRSVTFPGTTTTVTTTVPLAPIPVSPDRTITRDEALEQIRQRRGRARSAAGNNGTPRKPMMAGSGGGAGEKRDLSAPAR